MSLRRSPIWLAVLSIAGTSGCAGPPRADATSEGAATEADGDSETANPDESSESHGDSESESDDAGESDGNFTDDTPGDGDGDGDCDQPCGEAEWSYVYIANSSQNTLSKIDTRTMHEEGRYHTRPDGLGNPSRTSVTVDRRAVAVANRSGGITKIWARKQDCVDKNNNNLIDTSTGSQDIRPFAEEECVAWFRPFPGATTQRPVAWTAGTYNEDTCTYDDQKLWTAASYGQGGDECFGADGIWIYRLDGDTGEIDDTVHAAELWCGDLGAYGAAVDTDGNAWFTVFGSGETFRVDAKTLQVTTHGGASYGITVDTQGRPWTDAFGRYDLDAMQWTEDYDSVPGAGGSGIVQDLQGRMWKSTPGGVGWMDMETMEPGDVVELPGGYNYRGVGVDVDGYIWAVPLWGTEAYKIDPDTYELDSVGGLVSPYTYSDMAGGQLANVTCNPT